MTKNIFNPNYIKSRLQVDLSRPVKAIKKFQCLILFSLTIFKETNHLASLNKLAVSWVKIKNNKAYAIKLL